MIRTTGDKSPLAGFTLVEVLIAAAIFSMAMVFIVPANLMSIHVYQRYINRLVIQNWASEKIWEAKQSIFESDTLVQTGETSGEVEIENKNYAWSLNVKEIDHNPTDKNILYAIRLNISWPEGKGGGELMRNSYLVKIKEGL